MNTLFPTTLVLLLFLACKKPDDTQTISVPTATTVYIYSTDPTHSDWLYTLTRMGNGVVAQVSAYNQSLPIEPYPITCDSLANRYTVTAVSGNTYTLNIYSFSLGVLAPVKTMTFFIHKGCQVVDVD